MNIILPKAISGFPELLPEERIVEQFFLDNIRSVFEQYGFVSIETSAVERKEILTAKGGNDKEIYGLTRLFAENGDEGKDLALHFDLTVPLARYVAQNYSKLTFPFRRYQIQKVWRGERPQSGRYREFYQCDIDVIGDGELNQVVDAEIPSIIYNIFKQINIGPFVIKINNKKILKGYLDFLKISDENCKSALRIVDKLDKVGTSRVIGDLQNIGMSKESAVKLIDFASINSSNAEMMHILKSMNVNEMFEQGVNELSAVVENLNALGVPDDHFHISVGIARGLDYYTGTVYETILTNHPGIGSICSGGRYDDLASYFTEKKLPGVGISIGLTRLLPRLLQSGIVKIGPATTAPVLITFFDQDYGAKYWQIANILRSGGVNTEVYSESKKIGTQLKYAHKKGFAIAIIAGKDEFSNNVVKIKNLMTGEEKTVVESDILSSILAIIADLRQKNLWR